MYLRFGLSCLIIIIHIINTTLGRSNGVSGSFMSRHHHRRAVGLSEFLVPPALPVHRTRLSPPPPPPLSPLSSSSQTSLNNQYRHGKILNPQMQHSIVPAESPGYFSRFISWLNPFSGRSNSSPLPPTQSSSTSRLPPPSTSFNHIENIQSGELKPPPLPHSTQYKPPCLSRPTDHILPKPPAPSTGQSYSPRLSGTNCNSCNTIPWIPLSQPVDVHNSPYTNENIAFKQPSSSSSYEIRLPDFGYGLPQSQHEIIPQASNSHQNIDTPVSQVQYTSVLTGPIPNPHLYPGAIPPLFKATEFNLKSQTKDLISSIENGQVSATDTQLIVDNNQAQTNPNQHHSQSFSVSTNDHINSNSEYVDVLPPSAEVATGFENFSPIQSEEIHHDNGGSSSNFDHVLQSTESQEILSTTSEYPPVLKYQDNHEKTIYGTKLSSDGQHIIHIEESPVIDLSTSNNKTDDTSVSSSQSSSIIKEPSVILQNLDGTYGLDATLPNTNNLSHWKLDSEIEIDSTTSSITLFDIENNEKIIDIPHVELSDSNNFKINIPDTSIESKSQNISSHNFGVMENTNNSMEFKENLYDKHLSNNTEINSESKLRVNYHLNSTGEPFLSALIKSHNEFKKQEVEAKHLRLKFDPHDLHPGVGFTPSFGVTHREGNNKELTTVQKQNIDDDQVDRQRGSKRNKQVQIIIPYTSQYTPSPFHPSRDHGSHEEFDKSRGRKVAELSKDIRVDEDTRTGSNSDRSIFSYMIPPLDSWPKVKDVTTKYTNVKANTSIDVLRLQKNIDNWTIQEYSKGTTVSTISPISSHPHLLQSKKIPDDYFTTTESISVAATIREIEKTYGNVLAGFNYNDLEHEGSASSRIDISNIRVSSDEREDLSISTELDSTTTTATDTLSVSSTEEDSWEQLPVSISPLSNERVYVVTPQSELKSSRINNNTNSNNKKILDNISDSNNSTEKFEAIERAYQVLPEAVNNLAVASTGPATVPLWGIMEHEQYASDFSKLNSTMDAPILYSGHSKVSHTRQ